MPEARRDEQGRFTKDENENTGFRGPLTGEIYPTREARDHYEYVAAQRLANDPLDDPFNPNYQGPTSDDIKAAHQLVLDSQQDKAKDLVDQRSAQVFLELNEWFVPCAQNAAIMQTVCEARGLTDEAITVEQLEEIAGTLADRGLLKVNSEAMATQRKTEVREQADEIRSARKSSGISRSGVSTRSVSRSVGKSYNEDDLYGMSLDDLRSLAMREAGVE